MGGGVSSRWKKQWCSQFALVLWSGRQNTGGQLLLSCLEQCNYWGEKIEWMDVVEKRVGGRWRGDGADRTDGSWRGQSGQKLKKTVG